jgi:predicted nicotinamide N-methyase
MPHTAILQHFLIGNQRIEIFTPDGSRVKEDYKNGQSNSISPYWARVWPAAIGLCHFLQENLHYIQNKRVLELAAGLGLPGIFCAAYTHKVCISDIEPQAVELARQSALHNKLVNVDCRVINWNDVPEVAVPDVLLLSDINYEPAQFEKLLSVISYFLANQCTIILSTPQRLMAKDFITRLLLYCKEHTATEIELENQKADISIFVLKK